MTEEKQHKMFGDILRTIEHNSTCAKHSVAALLVKDSRIISMGWNGVTSAEKHCKDVWNGEDLSQEPQRTMHREWSRDNEVHAEMNAIAFAAKEGISTTGADLYVSLPPCSTCTHLILTSGIHRVFYKRGHKSSAKNIKKLTDKGIIVNKLTKED
jgi:dCMP deaminase